MCLIDFNDGTKTADMVSGDGTVPMPSIRNPRDDLVQAFFARCLLEGRRAVEARDELTLINELDVLASKLVLLRLKLG